MMTDWQEQLRRFSEANPDLPAGDDTASEPSEPSAQPVEPRQPRLDISIERKGRGGKTATLITGWTCSDDRLQEVAATLKKRLGTGGSARGGDILIQGDRRQDVSRELTAMGYKSRII